MRTLQDYINIYREIATNQNVTGDSVEILVQLLANASYINEIENLSYVQEASLEKSTLENSKIQHCMNNMYSVYRGSCPRVLIRFKPTKYFTFNMYDEIISSNNFKVYYLGYLGEGTSDDYKEKCDEDRVPILDGFTYGPKIISPSSNIYTIVGLIASEVVEKSWTLDSTHNYYVDAEETNLSNDLIVKLGTGVGTYENQGVTRSFSNHILNRSIFDLTTTDYSSRLYVAELLNNEKNNINSNTSLTATYFKLSSLSSYNETEMKKITLKGSELVNFEDSFLTNRGYTELSKGLIYIPEVERDNISTIHYKANRDRYVNSLIRTNSDLGTMLEEYFPNKVKSTSVKFNNSTSESIIIYYIPKVSTNSLTLLERSEFLNARLPYFLLPTIDQIFIKKGSEYKAELSIKAEISNSDTTDLRTSIKAILDNYSGKFNIDLESKKGEIKSLITKISCIQNIEDDNFVFVYKDSEDNIVDYDDIDLSKSYFDIEFEVRTIVKS